MRLIIQRVEKLSAPQRLHAHTPYLYYLHTNGFQQKGGREKSVMYHYNIDVPYTARKKVKVTLCGVTHDEWLNDVQLFRVDDLTVFPRSQVCPACALLLFAEGKKGHKT